MSNLENELSVEAVARALYDVAIDSLVPGKDAAILDAGVNAAARLAKMQGWDALDKIERRRDEGPIEQVQRMIEEGTI